MILSPEERLLFSLSSPNPSNAVLEDAARALSAVKSFDFHRLLAIARQNGVLPFLYKSLASSKVVPEKTVNSLRQAYLATAGSNIVNADETVRIIELLRIAGIEVIPLKGSIASELVFGDPGLYLASDIDILVKPSSLEKAKEVLVKEGYAYNETGERDLLSSHYHLILHRKGHHVELHWNLAKRYFNVRPEFWWEDTQIGKYSGRSLQMLSPERYILYAIFRLFDHGFRPLKFFVLVSALLEKYGAELDYNKMVASAAALRMKRVTLFTLRFLHEMLGLNRPAVSYAQRIWGYGAFRNSIVRGLFQADPRIHLKMLLYILLLDSPADVVKVLLRRIFPSFGEIRLRYGLSPDSKKVFFYYLLNPFFLVFRRR